MNLYLMIVFLGGTLIVSTSLSQAEENDTSYFKSKAKATYDKAGPKAKLTARHYGRGRYYGNWRGYYRRPAQTTSQPAANNQADLLNLLLLQILNAQNQNRPATPPPQPTPATPAPMPQPPSRTVFIPQNLIPALINGILTLLG